MTAIFGSWHNYVRFIWKKMKTKCFTIFNSQSIMNIPQGTVMQLQDTVQIYVH